MDSKTPSSSQPSSSRAPPPPLPPRQPSDTQASPYPDAPPPYSSLTKDPWPAHGDPRTSSTQSLVPSETTSPSQFTSARRKLLLIYIHGFMGNETSFRSFPAHVHNLLTVLMAETHVVHTKIYPRYRSKKKITFARDDFSRWLEPHEGEATDVVLLGHSMGGLLSAEVVLMPGQRAFKHRILGTINFDVPFLGMHPGVVKSGLASIFTGDDGQKDQWSPQQGPQSPGEESEVGALSPLSASGRIDTLWQPSQQDPNFNPSFENDIILPMRKGWQNALHFVQKHSNDLTKATKQLVTSHLEFGGAMANYAELKTRYTRIRGLEEEAENVRKSVVKNATSTPPRVRFINYYTASTGRVKKPKSPTGQEDPMPGSRTMNKSQTSLSPSMAEDVAAARGRQQTGVVAQSEQSRSRSPVISLEEHSDDGVIVQKEPEIPSDEDWEAAAETLTIDDPSRTDTLAGQASAQDYGEVLSPATSTTQSTITPSALPPIPDLPPPPPELNVSYIEDPETRKLVEKEHARATKAYAKAVKDREKAIRDRAKLEEKKDGKLRKEAERATKEAQKAKQKAERDATKLVQKQKEAAKVKPESEMTHQEKEELRLEKERQRMEAEGRRLRGEPGPASQDTRSFPTVASAPADAADAASEAASFSNASSASQSRSPSQEPSTKGPPKPKKERTFCLLPPKDSAGQRDPCWVRIFMANVDEVGAHCGLFFVDERYERLVGEVGERIEAWIREDMGERIAMEGEGEETRKA